MQEMRNGQRVQTTVGLDMPAGQQALHDHQLLLLSQWDRYFHTAQVSPQYPSGCLKHL